MSKPTFVYAIHIVAPQERIFDALLDPEMTKLYWARHRNASDWQPGSRWEHQDYDDANVVDILGQVVENDRPNRLVMTWSAPADADNPAKHSRVTLELAPKDGYVTLTVTHEDLEPDSKMFHGISMGWPIVLSSLKSLLEAGKPLPGLDRRWRGN